ncbi:serine O-acetyltransferase [Sinobacterium caligoides]|uniref:serine O-acetyltransferase n=1 Tax=Sinobacterium caligoides TaxID=933926 RepID=A0A3N2DGI4_9GAMM|nr:serine O-acetyltransferase [Sinobacterium caligoides]ROR98897.1 serine O-acetyltransferase [Sinobacterium caligoides]
MMMALNLFYLPLPIELATYFNHTDVEKNSMKIINNFLKAAIYECMTADHSELIFSSDEYIKILDLITNDLIAFCKEDPASKGKQEIIVQTSLSFSAVLHYRLAYGLMNGDFSIPAQTLELYASLVSSRGKLKSGADIHYNAHIGQRFVLDHGYGTVIGETTIIGDDCYFLNGVTLGATGISGNPSRQRHPIIGNEVQIGAFSKIFGNIKIGNNVFIGPGCTVIHDLPDGAKLVNNNYKNQELINF